MKRNWVRGMIGGLSFTSALFIFQACYGMPQDMMDDILLEGKVTSLTTGLPVEGIRVSVENFGNYANTNSKGQFSFYTPGDSHLLLIFEDIDPEAHGNFARKDTVLTSPCGHEYIDIALEEK